MSLTSKIIGFVLFVISVAIAATWYLVHSSNTNMHRVQRSAMEPAIVVNNPDAWAKAVETVKAGRSEPSGVSARVETPPELKHYSERHWFLATQIAEVAEHDIDTCRDFIELAAMLMDGYIVQVPDVTETYVLFGVGEEADLTVFRRFSVHNVRAQLDDQITPVEEEPLQNLARSFDGRSYNIADGLDRFVLKKKMLRSLRPEALKVMEEVAAAYHRQFDRPLPVSSLMRPEQYQHKLRRVNRNAVLIETPPHTTGLAFDIDFRYMSGAEQAFLMSELARIKNEGRIEVIRESNANYHVFAFIDGTRPNDELIATFLEKAREPVRTTHHATKNSTAKARTAKSGPRKARSSRH